MRQVATLTRPLAAVIGLLLSMPASSRAHAAASDPVTVTIDADRVHQRIDGFGASFATISNAVDGDLLTDDLRHRALDALFHQVHITTGSLDGALVEATADGTLQNDDDDPNHINWNGFQTDAADGMARFVLSQPEAAAFHDFALGQRIATRFSSPWLAALRGHDFARYTAEAAEQVSAALIYWRDHLNTTPRYVLLFNEPTTGNRELDGGAIRDVVAITKATGRRLRAEGFMARFIVPNEETEEASLATAQAILSDAEARDFVGAIGYHPYPYGSPYASVRQILASADRGRVNGDRAAARRKLADLASRYHVPVWMTEVSHGEVDARSFDDLRGRAIQIHDELEYANASAFFGMFAIWDMRRQRRHFGDSGSFWNEEGSIVLVDQDTGTVQITGIGYAIGHYARWLKPGADRLDVKSSDPLVLVSAFRDDASHRLVTVVINDANEMRTVQIRVKGLSISGSIEGEQSTAERAWAALPGTPSGGDGVTITVPPKSVTTAAGHIETASAVRTNGG